MTSKHKNSSDLYIRESIQKSGIYFLNKEIPVWIEEALPENINLDFILRKIENIIPSYFFKDVYSIQIGTFEELIDRQLNALYHEGTIYISNIQDDNMDMIDDIVHEISHSLEEPYGYFIYSDKKIENVYRKVRSQVTFSPRSDFHELPILLKQPIVNHADHGL